jgi:hypothetical protein
MSIRSKARDTGSLRDPSMKVPDYGEPATLIYIDAGQNPIHVPLHDLGAAGKRKCKAGEDGTQPCALCEAEVPVRHSWTVSVNQLDDSTGEIHPRTLWLSRRDLGTLGSVLPDSGTVAVMVDREIDTTAKTKRRDGSDWTVYRFALATDDGGDSDASEGDHA